MWTVHSLPIMEKEESGSITAYLTTCVSRSMTIPMSILPRATGTTKAFQKGAFAPAVSNRWKSGLVARPDDRH